MVSIYFVADRCCKNAVKDIADVFMPRDGICYDAVKHAVANGWTAIAFGDPDTFEAVDNYLCGNGLYDSGRVDIFDSPLEFFSFYRSGAPGSVFTDDFEFAKCIRDLEAAGR